MQNQQRKVVGVLTDLMFTVKIQEAAKRAGLDAVFVKTREEALAQAKNQPVAMIIDLNSAAAEPLELIEQCKADSETSKVNLIAFVSHVQADLKQAATDKGADLVVARSVFSQNLPNILKRYAG
ncbi:MAG TPA: response regulator [Bryobacteraceae bacterium]